MSYTLNSLKRNRHSRFIAFRFKFFLLAIFLTAFVFTNSFSQLKTVLGTVKDANNKPVEGATILVKETNLSTMADKDGKFAIKAKRVTGFIYPFSY